MYTPQESSGQVPTDKYRSTSRRTLSLNLHLSICSNLNGEVRNAKDISEKQSQGQMEPLVNLTQPYSFESLAVFNSELRI